MTDTDPDVDVPPISSCTVCGRPGCLGCQPVATSGAQRASAIVFERGDLELAERVLRTALESVCATEAMFGRGLLGSTRAPAWLFAVCAEALALGSFLLAFALAFLAFFSSVALELLVLPSAWLFVLVGYALSVTFLVLIHFAWGVVLDFSVGPPGAGREAQQSDPAPRQGVRFGLYACGWDLITSPFGLFLVWSRLPRGERASALIGALRAPKTAMGVYLRDAVELGEDGARIARRRALGAAALAMLVAVAAGSSGIFWLLFAAPLGWTLG